MVLFKIMVKIIKNMKNIKNKNTKNKNVSTWKKIETGIFKYESTGMFRARVSVKGKTLASPVTKSITKARTYRSEFYKMRKTV